MVDLSNALSGAGVGAGVGAPFGPWGAAIGGVLGGTAGLFGFGKGKPEKIKQLQNYTPEQQEFIRQRLQMAQQGDQEAMRWIMSILGDDPEAYADFERPAMDQFQNEIAPSVLERLNIGDNKYRSGVTNALASEAGKFSDRLAAQRANLKLSALDQLNNYANTGLSSMNTPYVKGGRQGAWSMLAPSAAAGYGEAIRNYRGGI